MNCREFIIEFEERGDLSTPATLHLTICADCQKTSERQAQIWLMIDGLKPVAAPNDFDYRVKAKIANAKPSEFQSPRFLSILRYVLPLSVVVLLCGFFAYNSTYFSDGQSSTQIAQTSVETSKPGVRSTVDSSVNRLAFVEAEEKKLTAGETSSNVGISNNKSDAQYVAAKVSTKKRGRTPKPKVDADSDITSHDTALTGIKPPILPAGINFNQDTVNAPKIENQKPVDDSETLKITGIKFVSENGKRTVVEVQKNSLAERSGVKVGDVVEKIKGSSLTVMRGTEKIEITLQNNVGQPR